MKPLTPFLLFLMLAACNNRPEKAIINNASKQALSIDTFTEGGFKFRIVHGDSAYSHWLEKLTAGKWVQKTELYYGGTQQFDRTQDITLDGYNDIIQTGRHGFNVYPFNPVTGEFIDTANMYFCYDYGVLDSVNKVYFNFNNHQYLTGFVTSSLYTLKSDSIYYLYYIYFDYTKNGDNIEKYGLFRCKNGNFDSAEQVSTTRLRHPLSVYALEDSLDFKKYWKREYRRLVKRSYAK
jgi:hypothetical protein